MEGITCLFQRRDGLLLCLNRTQPLIRKPLEGSHDFTNFPFERFSSFVFGRRISDICLSSFSRVAASAMALRRTLSQMTRYGAVGNFRGPFPMEMASAI